MTPLERELRRETAGLKISYRRTISSKGYDLPGSSGKMYRDKADALRRDGRKLRKQIEKLAKAPIEPTPVQLGNCRHYKGKLYEVIGIVRQRDDGGNGGSTGRCTAITASGSGQERCSRSRW